MEYLDIAPDSPMMVLGLPNYPPGEGPVLSAQEISQIMEQIRSELNEKES